MPYQSSKWSFGKYKRLSRLFQLYRGKGTLKEYMARPINGIVANLIVPVGQTPDPSSIFSGFPQQNILPKMGISKVRNLTFFGILSVIFWFPPQNADRTWNKPILAIKKSNCVIIFENYVRIQNRIKLLVKTRFSFL